MHDKIKRNLSRLLDGRGDSSIRGARDRDETTAGLDYMFSRGKKISTQDQSKIDAGERVEKSMVGDWNSAPKEARKPQRVTVRKIDLRPNTKR